MDFEYLGPEVAQTETDHAIERVHFKIKDLATSADVADVRRLVDDFIHDATQLVHRQDVVESRLVNVENGSIAMAAAARAMPALASKVADAMAHSVNAVEAKDAAKAAVEEVLFIYDLILDNWRTPWRILRGLAKRRADLRRPPEPMKAAESWSKNEEWDDRDRDAHG